LVQNAAARFKNEKKETMVNKGIVGRIPTVRMPRRGKNGEYRCSEASAPLSRLRELALKPSGSNQPCTT
jgi:hypothetical protein